MHCMALAAGTQIRDIVFASSHTMALACKSQFSCVPCIRARLAQPQQELGFHFVYLSLHTGLTLALHTSMADILSYAAYQSRVHTFGSRRCLPEQFVLMQLPTSVYHPFFVLCADIVNRAPCVRLHGLSDMCVTSFDCSEHPLIVCWWPAGFRLAVLTVDGPLEVQLPCNLDDDMNIVIENKGVPYPQGRGIHHVRPSPSLLACFLSRQLVHGRGAGRGRGGEGGSLVLQLSVCIACLLQPQACNLHNDHSASGRWAAASQNTSWALYVTAVL